MDSLWSSPAKRLALSSGGALGVASFCLAMSLSAGGWKLVFIPGTDEDRCDHTIKHPEGDSLFRDVCVDGGTEVADTGFYYQHFNDTGGYRCACCGTLLFPSSTKFADNHGWPSFWAPAEGGVGYAKDRIVQIEVRCSVCGAHLGHVFDDGHGDTGHRYCINSVCLSFDGEVEAEVSTFAPWVANFYLLILFTCAGVGGACCLPCYCSCRACRPRTLLQEQPETEVRHYDAW